MSICQLFDAEIFTLNSCQRRFFDGESHLLGFTFITVRPLALCRILQSQGNLVTTRVRPGLIVLHRIVFGIGNSGSMGSSIVDHRRDRRNLHILLDHVNLYPLGADPIVRKIVRRKCHYVIEAAQGIKHGVRGFPSECTLQSLTLIRHRTIQVIFYLVKYSVYRDVIFHLTEYDRYCPRNLKGDSYIRAVDGIQVVAADAGDRQRLEILQFHSGSAWLDVVLFELSALNGNNLADRRAGILIVRIELEA